MALQAPLSLPLAAFALKRWGLSSVQAWLVEHGSAGPSPPLDPAEAPAAARRLGWVVEVAAHRGPWRANCLQRSLTLWWFLRRRGLSGDLRIGVRRRPGGPPGARTLDFHAWVEHEGAVLNDAPDVRERFATFDRAIAPEGVRWS